MMTGEQIIKALECCRDKIFKGCDNCPMDEDNDCIEIVCANAVDFINRQQEEIERYHKEFEELNIIEEEERKEALERARKESALFKGMVDYAMAEAIKRFVVKLKKHACSYDLDNYHWFEAVELDVIDDVAKEFLGE